MSKNKTMPVRPVPPVKPSEKDSECQKCLEQFRQRYEEEQKAGKEQWVENEEELERLKKRAGEKHYSPEEQELMVAEVSLGLAREKVKHHPFAVLLLAILLALFLPGIVFGFMGMPESVVNGLREFAEQGGWQQMVATIAALGWGVVELICWLLEFLGAKSYAFRFITTLILIVVEVVGCVVIDEQWFDWWFCNSIGSEFKNIIGYPARRGRIKVAEERVAAAKAACEAAKEASKRYHKEQKEMYENKVKIMEAGREASYAARNDADNMILWRKKFEEFKHSDEYLRAQEKDAEAQENYLKQLAEYEKAMEHYEEAMREEQEKQEKQEE